MREHRQVPKRLRYGKFRKNLEEFKTREHTPDTAYKRTRLNINKILKEENNDIQPERQERKEAV